jgi:hypothetical protein
LSGDVLLNKCFTAVVVSDATAASFAGWCLWAGGGLRRPVDPIWRRMRQNQLIVSQSDVEAGKGIRLMVSHHMQKD